MTDPVTTAETDLKATISRLEGDLKGAKAQQELAKIKASLPAHWAGARTWVTVIGIAAGAYLFRGDLGTVVTSVIPTAKAIIITFLCTQAFVEAATVYSAAIRK